MPERLQAGPGRPTKSKIDRHVPSPKHPLARGRPPRLRRRSSFDPPPDRRSPFGGRAAITQGDTQAFLAAATEMDTECSAAGW